MLATLNGGGFGLPGGVLEGDVAGSRLDMMGRLYAVEGTVSELPEEAAGNSGMDAMEDGRVAAAMPDAKPDEPSR